jgi:hypothetical protein
VRLDPGEKRVFSKMTQVLGHCSGVLKIRVKIG